MLNQNPEETSRLFFETLNKLQIPTIVNTASGGIVKLSEFATNKLLAQIIKCDVFFVSSEKTYIYEQRADTYLFFKSFGFTTA
jgi:hypothetical protein